MSLLDLINQQRSKLQRGNSNRPEKLHSERNLIRILPSWTGDADKVNWQLWGQHFIKDSAGQVKAVAICVNTCFEEECRICDEIARGAAMTSDEETLRLLKDARSSKRVLINALYLKGGKHENPETTPVVLDLPPTVINSIFATYSSYKEEGIDVFDLNEGLNFIIEKTGTGMNTEYKVMPAPKSTKIDPKVMERVQNLDDYARQESDADKAKAVTTIRVLSGVPSSESLPRIAASGSSSPASSARLSSVSPEAVDADFVDVSGSGDSEIDNFLAGLGD